MYENGKMRPAETVPGMGGGGTKENGREGEFNYDIYIYIFLLFICAYKAWVISSIMIYCRHFLKCHNVPPAQQ
jgi:hypothetical protein